MQRSKKGQKQYLTWLGFKRFELELKRNHQKKERLKKKKSAFVTLNKESGHDFSIENIYEKFLPSNIKFLVEHKLLTQFLYKKYPNCNGNFKVPKWFSLANKPKESYELIFHILQSLINQKYEHIVVDYVECEKIELDAQIFLDVILLHFIKLLKECESKKLKLRIKKIGGNHFVNGNIKEMLYSVGSNAIHGKKQISFSNIIPYNLCVRNKEKQASIVSDSAQNDLDTTALAKYVIDCLGRMNKKLSPEKLHNLCTVIGEILINAEEHSTTKYRYSVGYFKENNENGKHTGIFHLLIFNLGETIYEKFKDPNCPTQHIVEKMRNLSRNYTQKSFFQKKEFDKTIKSNSTSG